jgi:hypothetical protein
MTDDEVRAEQSRLAAQIREVIRGAHPGIAAGALVMVLSEVLLKGRDVEKTTDVAVGSIRKRVADGIERAPTRGTA